MCVNSSDPFEDYKAEIACPNACGGLYNAAAQTSGVTHSARGSEIAPEVGLQHCDGEHNQQLICVLVE